MFLNEYDLKWIRPSLRAIYVEFKVETLGSLMTLARPILDLSSLEYLEILLTTENVKLETFSSQYPPDAFVLSSKTVRQLWLDTSVPTILRGVLNSSFEELSHLDITTSLGDIDIVINSLRSLPSLQSLFLTFSYHETHTKTCPPLRPSDIPRLRTLHIHLHIDSRASFDVLVNILTTNDALVGVEDFEFMNYSLPADSIQLVNFLCLLHSLRNVERITLLTFEFQEVDIGTNLGFKVPVHMPNLLHIQIHFPSFFSFIEAPSLHSLEVISLDKALLKPVQLSNSFGKYVATLEITGEAFNSIVVQQANHWDSVKTIRWINQQPLIGVKTTTLPSICSVEFLVYISSDEDPKITHNLNNFLVALLRYPTACPHLRTIKSDNYPVWALLIQVLLQRNQNRDLEQLEEISLPGLPIHPLLSLIVRLLNGSSNEVIPTKINHIVTRRYQHPLM
jgi:hypothetical protein